MSVGAICFYPVVVALAIMQELSVLCAGPELSLGHLFSILIFNSKR